MKLNKLLERQLSKFLPESLRQTDELKTFINAINDSYNAYDRDHELAERAFRLSEEEYREINKQLNTELLEKEASIKAINEALNGSFDTSEKNGGGGLLHIASFLQKHIEALSETERKLQEQKIFYERILNEIPADIAILDKEQRYLFINPNAIRDDATRQWIVGKTDAEYAAYKNRPYDFTNARAKNFEEVLYTGKKKEIEEKIITAKGQAEYHWRVLSPVFDKNGNLDIIIAYGINITERKNIEEQIRLSETKYRSIFNNSLALICTHNIEGRIIDINSAAVTMLGYDISEIKGSLLQNLIPPSKRAEFEHNYINEIKKNGKASGIMIAISKTGKRIYLLYQNYLVTEDTPEPYVIGFSQDITQRIEAEQALKISEEKYRNIIANMNLGLLEVDNNEVIVYANNSFCEMSGYETDELLGKNALSVLVRGENIDNGKVIGERRQLGLSDAYELKVKDKRGLVKWWLISGAPTYDNNGHVKGSIGIHLDITLQKTLEEDLRRAKSEAEHSAKAKEIFLANISHEIRTPMNAILGIGGLLAKTDLQHQQKAYLGNILTAANNLLVIINDLLDFTKIESGKMTLECIGFHLNDVMTNAVQILRHKAEEKGLLISFKPDTAIAPILLGDPYRINQVIMNLLSNSVKFTEAGSIHVGIALISATAKTQEIEFTVADTGIGMAKGFISHLFDKFSQEDESVTRRYGGTGLGMSIIKQLVELMGGKLNVNSEKHKGTVISFSLKLFIGNQADIPQTKNGTIDTKVLKDKTILLAEDNELNRLLATAILSNHGAEVKEAENGAIAIEMLKYEEFDLILMDVQMPVKDGLDTTRHIRSHISADIPIIAMTANAMKTQEEQCIAAGMNDFISKPFNEQGLLHMVGKWLGRDTSNSTGQKIQQSQQVPLFDLSKLKSISRGSDEFVTSMVKLFIEKTPPVLQQISEACANQDVVALTELAHRLKTSVKIMSIPSVDNDIAQLEALQTNPLSHTAIQAHVSHLNGVINEAIKQLERLQN